MTADVTVTVVSQPTVTISSSTTNPTVNATVSFTIRWSATGNFENRGKGRTVPPTDPAAFLGRIAAARSTASFAGRQLGFSFRSDPGVSTDGTYAEIGTERNGVFLT